MLYIYDSDDELFDEIVNKNLIHFTKNYCEAFRTNINENILLFVLVDDKNNRAFNVMIKRPITIEGFDSYFDLISPYGYGGWIIEGEYNSGLFHEFIAYCKENKIICEFERFDLFRTDISKYYGNIHFISHNIVKNVSENCDVMFADFERRVQKNIRKAIKNELSVIRDKNFEFVNDFLKIYYATMDRNRADRSYYFDKSFFEKIMKENAALFHVLHEGEIIATELVLYDNLCSYSFLGGTMESKFHLRPTELLKFEIMKWSHEYGLKYFVLGGGYGGDDGIFNYKKGLSPNGIYNFHVGTMVFDNEIYNRMCEKVGVLQTESSFFPAYRRKLV